MRNPDPLEMDYYPRLKIGGRWHLIVPETDVCVGCAFCKEETAEGCCEMQRDGRYETDGKHLFRRHDCGANETVFVRLSEWPGYRALLVAKKLEGET